MCKVWIVEDMCIQSSVYFSKNEEKISNFLSLQNCFLTSCFGTSLEPLDQNVSLRPPLWKANLSPRYRDDKMNNSNIESSKKIPVTRIE